MTNEHLSQQQRKDILWALRTRILTDMEMIAVHDEGPDLMFEDMNPSKELDRIIAFHDLLRGQFYMRLAKERSE